MTAAIQPAGEVFPRLTSGVNVPKIAIQTTGPSTWGFECYGGGDMYACMISDLVAAFSGSVTFGLIFGGFILLSLYVAGNGEIASVSIMTILLGGILVPALPGSYRTVAYSIMFAGMFVGLWAVVRRYVLEVGT